MNHVSLDNLPNERLARSSTHTGGQERDGLVHSSERRHIDGLTTDSTLGADTGGVFTRAGIDNGIDENLCDTTA